MTIVTTVRFGFLLCLLMVIVLSVWKLGRLRIGVEKVPSEMKDLPLDVSISIGFAVHVCYV